MTAAPRPAPPLALSTLSTSTLSALAVLGLALAAAPAPARASPLDVVWNGVSDGGDGAVQCADAVCIRPKVDPCQYGAARNACDFLHSVRGWCDGDADCSVGDPTQDHDRDLAPDSAERNACGRSAARQALDAQAGVPAAHCRDKGDLVGLEDKERDGLPDAIEPALCFLEDSNTGLDGSCNDAGTDYRL